MIEVEEVEVSVVDELLSARKALTLEKDSVAAEYREKAVELKTVYDVTVAEAAAASTVEQMSAEEREAVAAELAKVGTSSRR